MYTEDGLSSARADLEVSHYWIWPCCARSKGAVPLACAGARSFELRTPGSRTETEPSLASPKPLSNTNYKALLFSVSCKPPSRLLVGSQHSNTQESPQCGGHRHPSKASSRSWPPSGHSSFPCSAESAYSYICASASDSVDPYPDECEYNGLGQNRETYVVLRQ